MPTLRKVRLFLRAKLSGKDKKLQAKRDAICDACPEYVEHPAKNIFGKWRMQGFCKACGCGARKMADMKGGKNAHRDMKCPKGKWPGDAESMGLTIKEVNALYGAKDRLEYNMATVQNLIDKGKPLDPQTQAQIYGQPQTAAEVPQQPKQAAIAVAASPVNVSPQKTTPLSIEQFTQAFPNNPAVQTRRQNNVHTGRMALASAQGQVEFGSGI